MGASCLMRLPQHSCIRYRSSSCSGSGAARDVETISLFSSVIGMWSSTVACASGGGCEQVELSCSSSLLGRLKGMQHWLHVGHAAHNCPLLLWTVLSLASTSYPELILYHICPTLAPAPLLPAPLSAASLQKLDSYAVLKCPLTTESAMKKIEDNNTLVRGSLAWTLGIDASGCTAVSRDLSSGL